MEEGADGNTVISDFSECFLGTYLNCIRSKIGPWIGWRFQWQVRLLYHQLPLEMTHGWTNEAPLKFVKSIDEY